MRRRRFWVCVAERSEVVSATLPSRNVGPIHAKQTTHTPQQTPNQNQTTNPKQVGFSDPRVLSAEPIDVHDAELQQVLGGAKFFSVTFRLFKLPGRLEAQCEDYGQAATYKGTVPGQEDACERARLVVEGRGGAPSQGRRTHLSAAGGWAWRARARVVRVRAGAVRGGCVAESGGAGPRRDAAWVCTHKDSKPPRFVFANNTTIHNKTTHHKTQTDKLDADHVFAAGKTAAVCGNTASMLEESWLAPHFTVTGDRSAHKGQFLCAGVANCALSAATVAAMAAAGDSGGGCCGPKAGAAAAKPAAAKAAAGSGCCAPKPACGPRGCC